MDAPLDNLVRSAPFVLERADNDGLRLTGYGAVFNQWTEINSWEGRFKERIAPGAFNRTLKNNGDRVRLQFDHGQHPLIGSIPIGRIDELIERKKGLFVDARLSDNWLVQPVRDAISEGSIDGMSFRFTVVDDAWEKLDTDLPERTIREVRLMEVGPVVWPAYDGTSVGVRAHELARSLLEADVETRREVVRLLTVPDEIDTRDEESAEDGTSEDRPVTDSDTRDEEPADTGTSEVDEEPLPTYEPAQRRPSLPLSRLREQAAEIREMATAASSKEL